VVRAPEQVNSAKTTHCTAKQGASTTGAHQRDGQSHQVNGQMKPEPHESKGARLEGCWQGLNGPWLDFQGWLALHIGQS